MEIKRIIKNIIYFYLNYFFFLKPYPAKGVVLMYHSVGRNNLFFNVQPQDFIKQMNYLKKKRFKVVSLKQLVEWIEKKQPIPKKTIILTFDDGYQDNYFNVWPILKKNNFPATIFLVPDLINRRIGDSKNIVLDMLNWLEIREMHQSGLIDFQPHSLTHRVLNQIDLEQAEEEIKKSKEIIEEQLNKVCCFFAYPRGDFDEKVVNVLKKFGLTAGLTLRHGFVDERVDLFKLPRQSINSETDMVQFKGKLKFNFKLFN